MQTHVAEMFSESGEARDGAGVCGDWTAGCLFRTSHLHLARLNTWRDWDSNSFFFMLGFYCLCAQVEKNDADMILRYDIHQNI